MVTYSTLLLACKLARFLAYKLIATSCLLFSVFCLLSPTPVWAEVITLTPVQDTFVDQGKPTGSYGVSTSLQTKYASTDTSTQSSTSLSINGRTGRGGGSRTKKASAKETLIQFDLSSIPQGVQILKAELKLYSNYNRKFRKDAAARVYAVLGPWSNTTTWNTKPPRASSYEDSIAVTTTGQYVQWDITNLVQDWVDGVEGNFGVMIRSEGGGELYFSSRESSSNKPILYVEYTISAVNQNQPPTLSLEANPASGEVPLTVTFHSNAYDPDGEIVEYRWDYDGDGIVDEVTYSNPVSVTYEAPGTYNVMVEVVDNSGLSALDSVTVNVSSSPTPAPPPPPEEDAGVSDAPLRPANTRIIVVAKDGSGQYTSIQPALDNAQPGDTIQVKNGTYIEQLYIGRSGTREAPIALVAYPEHKPVLQFLPTASYPSFNAYARLDINGSWIIVDGFEMKYSGNEAIRIDKPHVTIRNNWIHNTYSTCVAIMSVGDVFIANNIIEACGSDSGTCSGTPKQCHNIYPSNKGTLCTATPVTGLTIRNNILRDSGGVAIHYNAQDCAAGFSGHLIEGNTIYGVPWAIALWYNVRNSTFRNNNISLNTSPATDSSHHIVRINGDSTGNQFLGNTFTSLRTDTPAFWGQTAASSNNTFDYNTWTVSSNNWMWQGTVRSDFKTNWKAVTGWDVNGTVNP